MTTSEMRATHAETVRDRLLNGLSVTERRLQLAGVSTVVLEGGDGPPMVLLHGPGEYAPKFFPVLPDLVTTHRVIAPDLPGHGESGVMDDPGLDRMLAWIDDLIDCTCSTPPVLVGHVIGGAIAARYASARGERVKSLVLVDATGLAPFQPRPDFGQALSAYLTNPSEETHQDLWRVCSYDLDALQGRLGERWEDIEAYNLDRIRVPDLFGALHAMMERYGFPAIPEEELSRIAVPVSLIWGRHDLATPLTVAEAASKRYGWPLRVVENAADDPVMDQPKAFIDALRATLASVGV